MSAATTAIMARHETSSAGGDLSLEPEAMRQIAFHAVASTSGRCYPTLLTTARTLSRAWRQDDAQQALRQRAANRIGEFMGVDCSPPGRGDIDEFSSHCLRQLDARGLSILRVYVALTEAYNCRANSSFLHRREWLCPWERWKMYVPPPIWECEASFIRVAAAFGGVPVCSVAQHVLEPASAQVRETVVALAAGFADAVSMLSAGSDAADYAAVAKIRAELARDQPLRKREADLAAVLRYYLLSGRMLLVRRWLGYRVGSPCVG